MHSLHMVCIEVAKTLFASDRGNLLTDMVETQIGDGPITNPVVKGDKSASWASGERPVLKAMLCSSFLPEKGTRSLDSATSDDEESKYDESDSTVPENTSVTTVRRTNPTTHRLRECHTPGGRVDDETSENKLRISGGFS